ncbi:TrfB-related DNA-binding protein, partial [Acinetobacter baumannii]
SKRWEQVSLDAAYRLMVLGESPKVLSDELGLTRQNLHRVVRTVWAAFIANLTQMGIFSLEEPAFYSALRPIQAAHGKDYVLAAYRLMVLGESPKVLSDELG